MFDFLSYLHKNSPEGIDSFADFREDYYLLISDISQHDEYLKYSNDIYTRGYIEFERARRIFRARKKHPGP